MKGKEKVKITQNPTTLDIKIASILFWVLTIYELESRFNCHKVGRSKMIALTPMLNSFLVIKTQLPFSCDNLHSSGI